MSGIIFLGAQPVSLNATPVQIHNATSISTTGSTTLTELAVKEISLVVNVLQAPTGLTPSLTFTIHEVDPGNLTTVFGTPQSITLNSIGISELTFPLTGSAVLINWTVSGTFPSVNSTISSKFGASSGGGSSGTTNQGDKGTANNSWYVELTDGTTALPIASSVTGTESTLIVRNIPPATQDVNITNSSLSVSVSNSSIPVQLRSEEVNGNNAPTYSTLVGGKDASGKIKPILVDNSGIVYVTGSVSNSSIAQSGQAAPSNCTFIGAVDNNLNLHGLNSDTSGRLFIRPIGTAGTPDTSVMTVQGITNGTPLPVTVSNSITNPSVSLIGQTAPTSITAIGGTDGTNAQIAKIITSSPSSSDEGLVVRNIPSGIQTISGSVNISNNLSIQGIAGGTPVPVSGSITATNASVSTIGSAVPSSATFISGTNGTNATPFYITTSSPGSSDTGLVVRNIPSGTQTISGSVTSTISGTVIIRGNGTAGSSDTQAVTVQGISNGTPMPVSGSVSVSGAAYEDVIGSSVPPNHAVQIGGYNGSTGNGFIGVSVANTTPAANANGLVTRLVGNPQVQISNSISISGYAAIVGAGTAGAPTGGVVSIQGVSGGTSVPVSISGTSTFTGSGSAGSPATGVVTVQGIAGGTAMPVSVSGTANVTSSTLALDSTLTNGNQKSIIRGGAKGTSTAADITSTSIDANTQALHVYIAGQSSSGGSVVTGSGTAGTPDTGVLTIQGISSGTPIPVTGSISASNPSVGSNSSTMPTSSTLIGGNDGTSTLKPISVDTNGAVKIIGTGSAGSPTSNVITVQGISGGTNVPVTVANTASITGTGTAGTPNSGVVTIQGISGGTTVPVSGTVTATNPSVAARGGSLPTSATLIGGSDGSLLTPIRTDASGFMMLSPFNSLNTALTDGTQVTRITNGTNNAGILNSTPNGSEYGLITRNIPSGTQTVSGTVIANIGTTNGLALNSTLTGGASKFQITDGSNSAIVSNSSPAGTEYGLITRNIPSGTQAVSGTITSNIGTTNGLALDSTLTDGTAKSVIRGGAKGSSTAADITSTSIDANTQALHVYIAGQSSSSGSVVTGGGTAGTPDTGVLTIQGIAGGTNIPVTGSGNFTVVQSTASNLNANVSGTVTANIGTTNGLALDSTLTGGTQRTKITDGTNNVAISSSTPVGTEQALVVRNIPSGTQTISGTVTANNPSVSLNNSAIPTSSTLIGASDGTNLKPLLVNSSGELKIAPTGTAGTASANVMTVQGISGGTPLPITGSISASNPSVGTNSSAYPTSSTLIGGINGSNLLPVTIKSASTTVSATDPALVVGISPNNIISIHSNDLTSGSVALGALNAAVTISTYNKVNFIFTLAAGTFIGTMVAETSPDGSTWNSTSLINLQTLVKSASLISSTANSDQLLGIIAANTDAFVRVRVSVYTSGTANASIKISTGNDLSNVTIGRLNSASPAYGNLVGGVVSSPAYSANTIGALSLTTAGLLRCEVNGANTAGTPSSAVLTIQGNASGVPVPVSGTLTASNPSVSTTGTTVPASATLIGGTDGSLLRGLSLDSTGAIKIATTSLPAAAVIGDSGNPAAPAIDAKISAANPGRSGWDRVQSGIATAAGVSSVQGFINNLTMVKGTATKPTITDGNFSPLYSTVKGELYVKTELQAAAAMADASANATTAAVDSRLMSCNNSGLWDKVRSGLASTTTVTGVLNDLPLAQYNTSRSLLTTGTYTNLFVNARGDLAVSEQFSPGYEDNANSVAYCTEKPFSNALNALTWYDSTTAIASAVVKASSGRLYSILCFNSNGATRYLQIFNTTSVPSAGAVPVMTFYLATNTMINIPLAPFGKYFSTGITIVSSTTLATYTAGTADLSVNIGYM